MEDVRGDVLVPAHGTTPAALISNKIEKIVPLKAMKTLKECGSYCAISYTESSSVTLN